MIIEVLFANVESSVCVVGGGGGGGGGGGTDKYVGIDSIQAV